MVSAIDIRHPRKYSDQRGHVDIRSIEVPPSTAVQPIALDYNGDLKIDLLGLEAGSGSAYKIWQNVWNASTPNPTMFKVYIHIPSSFSPGLTPPCQDRLAISRSILPTSQSSQQRICRL